MSEGVAAHHQRLKTMNPEFADKTEKPTLKTLQCQPLHHRPLGSCDLRTFPAREFPLETEIASGIAPAWELELEAPLEQRARNDATALQNQLRLGPHEDGADLEHPPGGR